MSKGKNRHRRSLEAEDTDEERYFLNPESVSCHLYCSICQEVFVDPQRAPCGHSFCKKCIAPWLKQSRTCPEDRKPLLPNQLHHDFILENIIGDQMVACPFRRAGCDYVSPLSQLLSHKKSCDFNPSNVPDFIKNKVSPVAPAKNITPLTSLSDDGLVSPGKPSLMMRLFRSGQGSRELLTSMFDQDKSSPTSPHKKQ